MNVFFFFFFFCLGGGGGHHIIGLYLGAISMHFRILNFNIFWGFQKNEYVLGIKIL